MSRIVFLNGSFLPFDEAKVPIMDRGFLFADGVYEGFGVLGGRIIDNDAHLDRLERSLREVRMPNPYRPRSGRGSRKNSSTATASWKDFSTFKSPAAWRNGISRSRRSRNRPW